MILTRALDPGIFGATFSSSAGTARIAPYQVTSGPDGTDFPSISAMDQYKDKSLEELRLDYYSLANK